MWGYRAETTSLKHDRTCHDYTRGTYEVHRDSAAFRHGIDTSRDAHRGRAYGWSRPPTEFKLRETPPNWGRHHGRDDDLTWPVPPSKVVTEPPSCSNKCLDATYRYDR